MASVRDEPRLHDIYRMRDLSGRLLYIGVTNGGLRRFMQHAKNKTWWREVAQIDVDHVYCSRAVIETIEREAIQSERPLYNVAHNAAPAPTSAADEEIPEWAVGELGARFAALSDERRAWVAQATVGNRINPSVGGTPTVRRACILVIALAIAESISFTTDLDYLGWMTWFMGAHDDDILREALCWSQSIHPTFAAIEYLENTIRVAAG